MEVYSHENRAQLFLSQQLEMGIGTFLSDDDCRVR
jgi:hypothetical protein